MQEKINFSTIYDFSREFLDNIVFSMPNDGVMEEEIMLINFLTTANTKYEELFEMYNINDAEQIKFLKQCMMLIIVSSAYKFDAHYLSMEIEAEESEEELEYIETLDADKIYLLFNYLGKKYDAFYTNKDYELLEKEEDYANFFGEDIKMINVIESFLRYSDFGFVFELDCLKEIYDYRKLKKLFKINPYEYQNALYYAEAKPITIPERIIQDFIDIDLNILDKSKKNILEEEDYEDIDEEYSDDFILIGNYKFNKEELQNEFVDAINKKCNYEEYEKQKLYGYIFGNVYEIIKIDPLYSEYNDLRKYLEDSKTNVISVIDRFENDFNFFYLIGSIFKECNLCLQENDLYERREALKEMNAIEVLKKFNFYYEEEEKIFSSYQKKK